MVGALVDLDQLANRTMQIGDRVRIDGTEYIVEHWDVARMADPNAKLRLGIMVREATRDNAG
ncbi:hypothetical protein [Mycobacterium aquaticum]|uniref:Uncharacterized protein n=1 Tax=Mycobacterium aquaticum TaxID=1927124 RepID=A0A1X0A883_9MYCO|nr:hypothetical protein [Mycobacterium aquaticum]ORA26270.1 hypothetical protein BST13_31895 [Mycobacterium aquaticum]